MATTPTETDLESLQFSSDTGTYRAEYDRETTTGCMAIVDAVAAVLETDPVELDPLYHAIETDALDELLATPPTGEEPVEVSFAFEGVWVSVNSEGTIRLTPPGAEPADGTHTH